MKRFVLFSSKIMASFGSQKGDSTLRRPCRSIFNILSKRCILHMSFLKYVTMIFSIRASCLCLICDVSFLVSIGLQEEYNSIALDMKYDSLIDWLIDWSIDWLHYCWLRLIKKLLIKYNKKKVIKWLILVIGMIELWIKSIAISNWWNHWLIDWLIDWLVDWLIDWMIDWLIDESDRVHQ